MKKTLVAALLAATMGLAHAQLTWSSRGSDALTAPFDPAPELGLSYSATSMNLGDLFLALAPNESAKVSFTYLGREAGWSNTLVDGDSWTLFNGYAAVGTEAIVNIAQGYNGAVSFAIFDPQARVAYNGGTWAPDVSIGLIATNFTATGGVVAGKQFQYVIGFNDSSSDSNDWDDLLVGVNVAAVNAVPEPSTYAMLLGGLGAIGFVGARRRQQR